MRKITFFLLIAISPPLAGYATITGFEENPFMIQSVSDMKTFRDGLILAQPLHIGEMVNVKFMLKVQVSILK